MRISIQVLSGHWDIATADVHHPGLWDNLIVGHYNSFGNNSHTDPKHGATGIIICTEKTRQMYHTIASAILDADRYFSLCETPLWLQLLYAVTRLCPPVRNWLVQKVVWIQIRAIFYKNELWEDHGYIPITYLWLMNPPRWTREFENWSQLLVSMAYSLVNDCIAEAVFGMSGSYPEYGIVDSDVK